MRYPRSEEYDKNFILENMMGPNSMKLAEEMLELQPIPSGSTVLDLGCGPGHLFDTDGKGLRVKGVCCRPLGGANRKQETL